MDSVAIVAIFIFGVIGLIIVLCIIAAAAIATAAVCAENSQGSTCGSNEPGTRVSISHSGAGQGAIEYHYTGNFNEDYCRAYNGPTCIEHKRGDAC